MSLAADPLLVESSALAQPVPLAVETVSPDQVIVIWVSTSENLPYFGVG